MKKVMVELKKKTMQNAYSTVTLQRDLGFPSFQKGEPMHDLVMEIKRDIMKQKKQEKMGWKDLLEFWPLSIVVPGMLILILMANVFQW